MLDYQKVEGTKVFKSHFSILSFHHFLRLSKVQIYIEKSIAGRCVASKLQKINGFKSKFRLNVFEEKAN